MKTKPITSTFTLLLFAAVHLFSAVDHEIAVVTKVRGLVMTSYGTDGKQTLTGRGELLFNRAVLHTGSNAMAQVRFINGGSTVAIPPESDILFTLEGISETVRVNNGKAVIEAQAPQDGSFDIATPVTMTTTKTTGVSLVTHERSTGISAFFLTGGTSLITDPDFSAWRPLTAPSAVYVRNGSSDLHESPLTTQDSARLETFVKNARSMKIGGQLTHTLIIRPDSGGTVSPGDTMTVISGYTVELVAKPDIGYVFSRWEVLDGAVIIANPASNATRIKAGSDARLAARFTNTPATLQILTQGEGTTSPESILVVPRYRPFKISAHPAFGASLKRWNISAGAEVVANDSLTATIILNDEAATVVAEFGPRRAICDVSATAGGSVTPGMNATVLSGDTLNVAAVADKGYSFICWETMRGRCSITNSRSSVTTVRCDSGDVQIRARFNKSLKSVQVTIVKHECADISPCGVISVPRGEPFHIHAVLKPGYEIRRWVNRLGDAAVTGREDAVVTTTSTCELVPEIATKTFNVTVSALGPGTTKPSGSAKVFYNTPGTVTAVPDQEKKFASWKVIGGDAVIANPLSPTTTVTLSSTDAVIGAEFAPEICTLTVDATTGGYVEPADTITGFEGKQFGLKAVPNPQAAFLGWVVEPDSGYLAFSDTVTEREQVITVKKTRNAKITARFSTKTVELTILNNGLGVTDPVRKLWIPQEQWVSLKAEPAEGNKFEHWVIVSGPECEIKDQFSLSTELNPGTQNATVKALFDATSGYPAPEFKPAATTGEYRLSLVTEGEKGSVSPPGPIQLKAGTPVTLSAEPRPGYMFSEWIIQKGDCLLSDQSSSTTSVILVKQDAIVECRFLPEKSHVIEVQLSGPQNQSRTIVLPYR